MVRDAGINKVDKKWVLTSFLFRMLHLIPYFDEDKIFRGQGPPQVETGVTHLEYPHAAHRVV